MSDTLPLNAEPPNPGQAAAAAADSPVGADAVTPNDDLPPVQPELTDDGTAAAPATAEPDRDAGSPSERTAPGASAGSDPPVPALTPAACAARLAELFPAVFSPGAAKPLKLRIQVDIQQRVPATFTRKVLSLFLQRHTTGTPYLRALAKQPQRFDLDGQPAGAVSDEHREAAAAEVTRRHAMHEERRAAERLAQRKAQDEARRQHAAQDEARRGRAAVLRAFETTTLTRSNFCALKNLPEAELDALLVQARLEREQFPPAAAPAERYGARPGPAGQPRHPGDRERQPTQARSPQRHPGPRPKPGT